MSILIKVEEWLDDVEEWYAEIDDKVEETLDHMYEVIPGKYFGILGLIFYLFSTFTAVFLYLLADPSYSMFTHWISHLGDGPNGSQYVFNFGWITSSFILFFFYVHEIRILREKGVKERYLDLLSLSSLLFASGLLLIGVFPLHLTTLHTIVAVIYFAGGFGFTILYGLIAVSHSEISNSLAFTAFFTAITYLVYFLSPVIDIFTSRLGMPLNPYFLEWSTLLAEFLFIFTITRKHFLVDDPGKYRGLSLGY